MEDLKKGFNPNDWLGSSSEVMNNQESRILNTAESLIANSIDGEKHHMLCKASFLLGGYIAANELTESVAQDCLRNAIAKKSNVKNLEHAYKTINKCVEAGKKRPISRNDFNSKDNYKHFNYSNFKENESSQNVSKEPNLPDFPIDTFPKVIKELIVSAKNTVGFPINYFGTSILFAASATVGSSCKLKVRGTQHELALTYMALVGAPGVNKSHPLKFALKPLFNLEEKFNEEYDTQKSIFDIELENYNNLKANEKSSSDMPVEPVRNQIIVSDITQEALIEVHNQNPKGLCLYRDELSGFFNDFNKYRKGSDEQFWLSNWNNFSIKSNRKTDSNSFFIKEPYISVIGTIQNGILIDTFKGEKMKNGLIDRFLFVFPESSIKPYFSDGELNKNSIESYNRTIQSLYELRNLNTDKVFHYSGDASVVFKDWYNHNVDIINNEKSEIIRSIHSKIETYISRFSLILHLLFTATGETKDLNVNLSSLNGAIQLAEYFRETAILVRNMISKPKEEVNMGSMAKFLSKQGQSLRDTGEILGISHTQVGKLLKST